MKFEIIKFTKHSLKILAQNDNQEWIQLEKEMKLLE